MTTTQHVTIATDNSEHNGRNLEVKCWTSLGTVHVWISDDEYLSFDAGEIQ
jgi:hypothetical protein